MPDEGHNEDPAVEPIEEDSGLDGCKVVNDHHDVGWLLQDHGYYYPLHHHYQRRQSNASEMFSESWTPTASTLNDGGEQEESLSGEALSLRAGEYRARLTNAVCCFIIVFCSLTNDL